MKDKVENYISGADKLDAVLTYLNENRKLAFHYGYGLPREYSKPKKIILSDQDILNVLDKLLRDKMVRMTIMGIGNGNSAEHYTISLDGEVLLNDGGYTQKLIDERTNKDVLSHNLITSQKNEKIVKIAAIFAAIGAIGILVVELYKLIYSYLFTCPC